MCMCIIQSSYFRTEVTDVLTRFVRVHCTHPLHKLSYSYPSLAYLRRSRGIPQGMRLFLRPHWPPDTPGTWWWCAHCRNRNTRRSQAVIRMYTRMRTVTRPMPHAKRCVPVLVGERFLSVRSMHLFAHRHTPPGLAWCAPSAHYVPADELCRRSTHLHWCQACWAMQFPQRKALQRLRIRRDKAALQAEYDRLARQRDLLRKEARDLRNVIAMLHAEAVVRPHGATLAPEADAAPWAVEPEPVPTPPRRTRDRRKSFST
jgi:hypothetical protein